MDKVKTLEKKLDKYRDDFKYERNKLSKLREERDEMKNMKKSQSEELIKLKAKVEKRTFEVDEVKKNTGEERQKLKDEISKLSIKLKDKAIKEDKGDDDHRKLQEENCKLLRTIEEKENKIKKIRKEREKALDLNIVL